MLLEEYKNIYLSNSWNYYNSKDYKASIEKFPLENHSNAKNFIENCFNMGDKNIFFFDEIPEDVFRNLHSVSAFFLGLILKDIFDMPNLNPDFRYLWFLSCLYHDYGYFFEDNREKYAPKDYPIKHFKKELQIKYDILRAPNNRNPHLSLSTVSKYYRFCRENKKFINHGIVGGLLFYDRMIKNFYKKFEAAKRKCPDIDESFFIYNNLEWSTSHFEDYRKVADAIINHNIWYAYETKDIKTYKKRKLQELIIYKEEKPLLNHITNPFLFLLIITDTIEPVKAFRQFNFKYILEKISIKIDKKDKKISISILDDCINYHTWFCNILKMEKWACVKVDWNSKSKEKTLAIYLI